MKNKSGITLIELIIVMAIFSIAMAGLYSSYEALNRQGTKEYRRAEVNIENNIASNIIERDLIMAGYGIAEDYSGASGFTVPLPISATDGSGPGGSDTLTLTGTALGLNSRGAQGWSYLSALDVTLSPSKPTFTTWNDSREDLNYTSPSRYDVVIMIEPIAKSFMVSPLGSTKWMFNYQGPNTNIKDSSNNLFTFTPLQVGTILYGLYSYGTSTIPATQPYNAVRYLLDNSGTNTPPASCDPSTFTLVRAESNTTSNPGSNSGQPILNCVLDFQVAIGLDTDDDGVLDSWDNGGVKTATYAGTTSNTVLNRRVKQIRVYILVQDGNKDLSYTYSNPDTTVASNQIRVGDLALTALSGGGVGRTITLTPAQLNYRWKLLSFAVTPRNIR